MHPSHARFIPGHLFNGAPWAGVITSAVALSLIVASVLQWNV